MQQQQQQPLQLQQQQPQMASASPANHLEWLASAALEQQQQSSSGGALRVGGAAVAATAVRPALPTRDKSKSSGSGDVGVGGGAAKSLFNSVARTLLLKVAEAEKLLAETPVSDAERCRGLVSLIHELLSTLIQVRTERLLDV